MYKAGDGQGVFPPAPVLWIFRIQHDGKMTQNHAALKNTM